MKCLTGGAAKAADMALAALAQPFVVDTHGSGAVMVSNVRIVRGGKPSAACQPNRLLRRLNNRVNERLASLHDGRDIFFLDINASLMSADGTISRNVMPDLLHLSEKGYRQWARDRADA